MGQCLCQWSDVTANRRANKRRIIKAHAAARRGMCRRVLRQLEQNAHEQHSARREQVIEQQVIELGVAEQLQRKTRDICAQITRAWRARVQELAQERRRQAERSKRRELMEVVLEAASRRALEHKGCQDNCCWQMAHGQEHGAHALCRVCRAGATSRQRSPQSQGHAAHYSSAAPEGASSQHGAHVSRGAHPDSGCHSSDVLSEEDARSAGSGGIASGSAANRTSEQNLALHKFCDGMAERQVTQECR